MSETIDNFKHKDIKKSSPGWLRSWVLLPVKGPGVGSLGQKMTWRGTCNSLEFLPGKSSRTEELGRLHSIGLQGLRHNLATKQQQPNVMRHMVKLSSLLILQGFPGGSDSKESACNVGYLSSIPGLWRSPGGGHGKPLQYSFLENPHGQRNLEGYSP